MRSAASPSAHTGRRLDAARAGRRKAGTCPGAAVTAGQPTPSHATSASPSQTWAADKHVELLVKQTEASLEKTVLKSQQTSTKCVVWEGENQVLSRMEENQVLGRMEEISRMEKIKS
eukprot:365300-Chlamydomonas_euryale.AAC.10